MRILTYGLIAAVTAVVVIASPAQSQDRCGWTETVYNSGEPVNSMQFEGTPTIEGRGCLADTMQFNGFWNDGPMTASIYPMGGETFAWRVDNRQGIAQSWDEAWAEIPGYLTDPDHSERHSEWGF